MGDKITRWRGDVKERRAGTGFRPFNVWATKSPGGGVTEGGGAGRGGGAGGRGGGGGGGGRHKGGGGGGCSGEAAYAARSRLWWEREVKSRTFTQGVRKKYTSFN